jgi:putative peptidoglycan lipid II flippase
MRRGMKASVLLVMAASAVVGVTGFLREMVAAYFFGTSAAADAFSLILVYIEGIYVVISVGIASYMLVPLVVRLDLESGTSAADRLTESLQLWTSIVFIPIALAAWLAPEATARAMAPGFNDVQHALLTGMLPAGAACALLLVIGGLFAGVLQARDAYLGPILGRGAFNLGVLGMLMLAAPGREIGAASQGLIAGGLLQLLLQITALWRSGWRPRLPRFTHLHMADALASSLPVVIGLFMVNVLAVAVQRAIGSNLEEGSLSAVNYAQRTLSVVSFLSLSIGTVSLTRLSAAVAKDSTGAEARRAVARHLSGMAWVMVPLSLWLAVVAAPLVVVLFQRGAYSEESARLTAECLRWFAASLLPGGLLAILHRASSAWDRNWQVAVSSVALSLAVMAVTFLLLPRGATALPIALLCGTVAGLFTQAWLMRQLIGLETLTTAIRASGLSAIRALVALTPILLASSWFLAVDVSVFSMLVRLGCGLVVMGGLYAGIGLISRDALSRELLRWPGQTPGRGV